MGVRPYIDNEVVPPAHSLRARPTFARFPRATSVSAASFRPEERAPDSRPSFEAKDASRRGSLGHDVPRARSRRRLIFAELPAGNHRAGRCGVTQPAAPLHSIMRQGHASRPAPAPCMIVLRPFLPLSPSLPSSRLLTCLPSFPAYLHPSPPHPSHLCP